MFRIISPEISKHLQNNGCPVTRKENKGIRTASMYAFFLFAEIIKPISTAILMGSMLYSGNDNKWLIVGNINIANIINASIIAIFSIFAKEVFTVSFIFINISFLSLPASLSPGRVRGCFMYVV